MNLREIYSLLLAGKTMRLGFTSESEKETFRVRLFKFKRLQEYAMAQIGMVEPDDLNALSFSYRDGTAIISLTKKRRLRDYNVIILDDGDDAASSEEATVSRDLGTNQR